MHLMFSNEKNFKKMNIFLPFWSKVCDISITTSECKLLIQKQKDSKKNGKNISLSGLIHKSHR